MQQIFADTSLKPGQRLDLNKNQYHHLINVLRLKDDETIRVADNTGCFFGGRLIENGRAVLIEEDIAAAASVPLIYGAALIKKEKWDMVIQKGCELGATVIVPLITERTIIRIDEKDISHKVQRWNSIAQTAAAQCHGSRPSLVESPMTLKQAMQYKQQCNIVAYEKQGQQSIKKVLTNGPTAVFIDPEGGWTEKEIAFLNANGFISCSLGSRILRAETAGLYALAVIDAERNG